MIRAAKSLAIVRWLAACLVVVACALAQAQNPPPLPQPNLPLRANGEVFAIVRQPDGGVVFGGRFTEVNGVPRSNLARVSPDGSLDPSWNPAPDAPVYALAVEQSTGAIYVGGLFFSVGDQQRTFVAKVAGSGAGTVDPDWNPGTDGFVPSLAVGADGSVYIGGEFFTVGGLPRLNIAKVSGSGQGTVDPTWNPSADRRVLAIQVDASGSVYAGGWFTSIGGMARNGIAKLSASGTGDADPTWNPAPDVGVAAIALDGAGAVYVGGGFSQIGGQARNYIAKLSADGTGVADAIWNPSADDQLLEVVVADGSVYVGGIFNTIGGQARRNVAKLSAAGSGAADPDWNPSASSKVTALLVDEDGSAYVGGSFSDIGNQTRRGFARLEPTGINAPAVFDAARPGEADALAVQPDGGVVVGGYFYAAGDQLRANVLRLLPDGTLDPLWNPSVTNALDSANVWVAALATDDTGAIYAAGIFDHVGDETRNSLAKLSADGTGSVDAAWNPSADGTVLAMVHDAGDSIYIGGAFANVSGEPRGNLAKLSASGSGSVDPSWNPSANFAVRALATDAASSVYVGGLFSEIGGESRSCVAKVSAETGIVDPAWNPGADGNVYALAPDNQGSIFVGGEFFNIGGEARNGVAKLATAGAGTADPVWNPSTGFFGFVYGIALDDNGSIFVGGNFYEMGGVSRNSLAKLSVLDDGSPDPIWNPGVGGGVNGLRRLALSGDRLYAAGGFTEVGGEIRDGIAALPTSILVDTIFADGFDGSP